MKSEAIPKIAEINGIARLVRSNLIKDGRVQKVAFLWTGNRVTIVGAQPQTDDMSKDAWGAFLRRLSIEFGSDAILTVTEIWAKTLEAGKMSPDDMIGPVKEKTGAYEGVLFVIETMQGTWACIAPIIRVEGQAPAFPMPRFWNQGPASGAMANLLPDKDAGAYMKDDK